MFTTEAVVTLEPVTFEGAATLGNLFELYAHDFSEHVPLQIKASGRFEVTPSDVWWTRNDHFGYFIKFGAELAGFALVRTGSRVVRAAEVMDIAEFFVLRGFRRKGVGSLAARALFKAFPGPWEIRVRRTNVAAMQFWSAVAAGWVRKPVSSSPFSIEGVDWDVLRFVTRSEEFTGVADV
jgi:predicted acetyltransferase